ncbi:MAG: hypothetical protein AB7P49_09500 [Bdellovibrionales bacterium]
MKSEDPYMATKEFLEALDRKYPGKIGTSTKQSKRTNEATGFGAVLAAQAELNNRLKELEGKRGRK